MFFPLFLCVTWFPAIIIRNIRNKICLEGLTFLKAATRSCLCSNPHFSVSNLLIFYNMVWFWLKGVPVLNTGHGFPYGPPVTPGKFAVAGLSSHWPGQLMSDGCWILAPHCGTSEGLSLPKQLLAGGCAKKNISGCIMKPECQWCCLVCKLPVDVMEPKPWLFMHSRVASWAKVTKQIALKTQCKSEVHVSQNCNFCPVLLLRRYFLCHNGCSLKKFELQDSQEVIYCNCKDFLCNINKNKHVIGYRRQH